MMGSYMTGGGFFGQQNLGIYSYAWNNPVAMRDPDGRVVGSVNTREQAEAIKQAEAAEVRMAQDAWDRAGRAMARGGGLGVARAFWETNHGHPEVGNNLIGGIRFVGQEAIAETEITAEHFPMGLYQGMTWAAVGGVGEFIMGEMLGAAVGASTTGGGGGRMIRGFHGTTGDNVLGILDTGGFVPKNGRTFLSEGVGDTFKFGADLSRRASFSIEVEVPEGAASVLRIATPGVPRTLVLRSQSTIPANVLRLFVRRPDGAGGFTTEIIEKAAIRAYLSP
jgi:hypothetical protein